MAQQWLDRVARAGGPVVNVRVKTVVGLAQEIAAPSLVAQRRAPASAAARRLVVAAAWAQAMAGEGGYLASVRTTPRLLGLVERAILDLRLAGLGPESMDERAFEHPLKGRELKALLGAYQRELEERRLVDHADALRLAAEVATRRADVVLIVPEDLRLSVLEQRLLDALAAGGRVRLPVDDPERLRAADGPRADRVLLAWLSRPADAPEAAGDGTATIFHAVGEANEVRHVLRTCLAEETPLDALEIVCTRAEPYVPLLYETAQRVFEPDPELDLGVPVTFADGVPARITRPGRLLSAWIRWIEEGFPQVGLLRIVQAHLIRLPGAGGETMTSGRLAEALREVPVGFGRDRYLRCLDEAIAAAQAPPPASREDDDVDPARAVRAAEGRRRKRAALTALRELARRLLEVSPPRESDARRIVTAARRLCSDLVHAPGRLDRLACQHLTQELGAMADGLSAGGASGFDVWAWLEELPQRARVAGSGPRPGHLHVSTVRAGGHSGRPRTFVVGLDDGRFPPAGLQDPLVLDRERAALDPGLATAEAQVRQHLEDFGRLLGRLQGRVTLSFPSRDLADNREMFASPVVLAAYRILANQRAGDHRDLGRWLGPAASFAPAETSAPLDAGEWWMDQGTRDPAPADLAAELARVHPSLERGRQAAAARASDVFTVFDGLIERPGPDLDPRSPGGPAVSASGLQTLGTCPLHYFYARVLGIEPLDDVAVEPDAWLDSLQFGTLLHEVLYDFVGALRGAGLWPPDLDRDRPCLDGIVQGHLARARRQVPPPGEEPFVRQKHRLQRSAEIFVEERGGARREPRGRPEYLEAALGLPSQGAGTPLDTPDPIEIELPGGATIRARARLDRIDRLAGSGPPRFAIWDYKSGGYVKPYDPPNLFDQGRLLQHVVYMATAEAALRAGVAPDAIVEGFYFFFPDPRTHGRPVGFPRDIVAPGLAVVEKLCAVAAGGAFVATNDQTLGDCRFCDYQTACRSVHPDLKDLCRGSARKMANPDNAALKPFVELRLART